MLPLVIQQRSHPSSSNSSGCDPSPLEKAHEPLLVLRMGISLDVTVTLALPEGGLGVGCRERLGVLEGHHLVVAGVDDHKRNPFAKELFGLLLRPHRPDIYAQKEPAHQKDARSEEGRQAAELGDPLPQQWWQIRIC